MRISLVSDIHFKGKKLQDKIRAWEDAVTKIIDSNSAMCILAGDIFEKSSIGGREASTGTVYRAFMQGIDRLKKENICIYAIEGNHDQSIGDQLSALEPLKDAGIIVLSDYQILNIENTVTKQPEAIISMLPWITDTQKINEWIEATKTAFNKTTVGYKIITGHAAIQGATYGSGIEATGNITPFQLNELGADCIAFGHIHKRQQFYIGALSQDSFGDEGNPQGFLLIDTETRTQEFINIDAPKYITITSLNNYYPISNNYQKLRLKEKPNNYDELLENPKLTIEIVPDAIVNERKIEGIESGRTIEQLLEAYLKARNESDEAIKRIVELAKGLNNENK